MHRPSCPPTSGWYVVGDLAIDLRGRTVRRPDGIVELTPRNFDLLCLLLHEPDTVHSRESLFERVWGTTCLEDGNLSQAVSVLRKTLGESRKDWIRTVAKRGYVFAPPSSAQWHADWPQTASVDAPAPSSRGLSAASAQSPAALRARILPRLAMSLVAALALVTPGAHVRPATTAVRAQAGHAQTRAIGIVVIAAPRPGATAETRVATRMLGEWLRWKLGWLPAVSLVDDAQAVADPGLPTYVLDVAIVDDPAHRGRRLADIALRPAIANAGEARTAFRDTLAMAGGEDRLMANVDAASRHAMSRLFPLRDGERWPALALDLPRAERYLAAVDAERAHDPVRAEALLTGVVREAPTFAPALWRLATRRGALHREREAAQLAQRVAALSDALPRDARRLLAASADALSTARAERAAAAFAALHRANPARIDFLLAQAEALQRALRPEAAMRLLVGPQWDHQPLDVRIRQRLARADTAFTLGSYDIARESAGDAIALIAQTDGGWRHELGAAQLVRARAWHQQFRNQPADASMYLAAERTFREAGLALDAELAAFHRAYMVDDDDAAAKLFAPLLSAANANGDTRLALQLMRMMTQIHDADGRTAESSALRLRAYRLAERSGERIMRDMLGTDLLDAAVDDGDARTAALYLERLRDNRLWAKYRSRIARAESNLDMMQGRYRDALAVLDRFLAEARHNDELAAAQVEIAKIACLRMDALIALGEVSLARAQVPACRDIGSGSVPIWATMGRADIARIEGDTGTARELADEAERLIADRSRSQDASGWWASLAAMRLRLSQPDAAERSLRAAGGQPGEPPADALKADLEATFAELAAVRGDWSACSAHGAAARALASSPDWSLDSRLQLLEGAHLQAQGRIREARSRLETLAARADRLGDLEIARAAEALLALRDPGRADATPDRSIAEWLAPPLRDTLIVGGATSR